MKTYSAKEYIVQHKTETYYLIRKKGKKEKVFKIDKNQLED